MMDVGKHERCAMGKACVVGVMPIVIKRFIVAHPG